MNPLILILMAQLAIGLGLFTVAGPLTRRSSGVWAPLGLVALVLMLCFGLNRLDPAIAIHALGAKAVACLELTGIFMPTMFVFGIAARRLPKKSDRRAIVVLSVLAAIFAIRSGWWMTAPIGSGVPELGGTQLDAHGVCLQSTGYTCVAASMVTLLHARTIDATETEMARLAHTSVGEGTTDSRAIWALEDKLKGTPYRVSYESLPLMPDRRSTATHRRSLLECPKPCLVQLDWGLFVSHMVPVLEASPERVILGDPLEGRREMPTEEFARQWKGMAVIVE